jgi:signal peptidase I
MLPTIKVGASMSYVRYKSESEIARGDIVVYMRGQAPSAGLAVSRLIGMPVDGIQMRDGVLYLNGAAVPRVRLQDFVDPENTRFLHWQETLSNGVSYGTLDLRPNGFYDNTPVYNVPQSSYFVISDNRDNSTDSRALDQVGYIPARNILSRVVSFQ